MFYGTKSLIRHLSLEMPADEKARAGLTFAGGISRKLDAFCEKPLLPPPDNRDLFLDCRRNIVSIVYILAIVLLRAI